MAKIDEMIYVGDPMCSWCWGAANEITQLKEMYGTEIPFKVILGGLRPGTTAPMQEKQKQFLKTHWEEIQEMTGQPFDFKILERNDFVYDTEPAARAVVSIRKINPAIEFDFFKAIQYQFYAKGKDTNLIETYLDVCEEYFIEPSDFEEVFNQESTREATSSEFDQSRSLGIVGFPTVLIRMGAKYQALARGYSTLEKMQAILKKWIAV